MGLFSKKHDETPTTGVTGHTGHAMGTTAGMGTTGIGSGVGSGAGYDNTTSAYDERHGHAGGMTGTGHHTAGVTGAGHNTSGMTGTGHHTAGVTGTGHHTGTHHEGAGTGLGQGTLNHGGNRGTGMETYGEAPGVAPGATNHTHGGTAAGAATHGGGGGKSLTGKIEHAAGTVLGSTTLKAKGAAKEREAQELHAQAQHLSQAERLEEEAQKHRDHAVAFGADPNHRHLGGQAPAGHNSTVPGEQMVNQPGGMGYGTGAAGGLGGAGQANGRAY